MSPLQEILNTYRAASQTGREKGTYFEELIRTSLRSESPCTDLCSSVWPFSGWVKAPGADYKLARRAPVMTFQSAE